MTKVTQYNNVFELEYLNQQETLRIGIEDYGSAYAKIEEIEIDPKVIELDILTISSKGVKLKFSAPIACNIISGKKTTMDCGVKLSENFDIRFPMTIIQDDNSNLSTPLSWQKKVKQTEAEIKERWTHSKH